MLIRNLLLRLLTNGPAIWLLLLLLSVRTALKYAKVRSLDCKVAYEQKDAKMETRLFVFVLVLSHLMPLLSDYAKISLETLVQRDCYVASYDFALKSQPGATTEIGQNLHAQCSRFAKSIRLVFVAIGYYAPIKAICFWFNQRQIRRQMAGRLGEDEMSYVAGVVRVVFCFYLVVSISVRFLAGSAVSKQHGHSDRQNETAVDLLRHHRFLVENGTVDVALDAYGYSAEGELLFLFLQKLLVATLSLIKRLLFVFQKHLLLVNCSDPGVFKFYLQVAKGIEQEFEEFVDRIEEFFTEFPKVSGSAMASLKAPEHVEFEPVAFEKLRIEDRLLDLQNGAEFGIPDIEIERGQKVVVDCGSEKRMALVRCLTGVELIPGKQLRINNRVISASALGVFMRSCVVSPIPGNIALYDGTLSDNLRCIESNGVESGVLGYEDILVDLDRNVIDLTTFEQHQVAMMRALIQNNPVILVNGMDQMLPDSECDALVHELMKLDKTVIIFGSRKRYGSRLSKLVL